MNFAGFKNRLRFLASSAPKEEWVSWLPAFSSWNFFFFFSLGRGEETEGGQKGGESLISGEEWH